MSESKENRSKPIVTVRGITYYPDHFEAGGESFGYETIYHVFERMSTTAVNGFRTSEKYAMGFGYVDRDGKTHQVDLGFAAGLLDFFSKRSERLPKLFQWIQKETKSFRMRLWMDAVERKGYFEVAKDIGFDLDGGVYHQGVLVDNVRDALLSDRLMYGVQIKGAIFRENLGSDDYLFVLDSHRLKKRLKFHVHYNKDIFDELFSVMARS